MISFNKLNRYLMISFIIISIISQFISLNPIYRTFKICDQKTVQLSSEQFYKEEWITNPNFTNTDSWFYKMGDLGDPLDLNATIAEEQANFLVYGDKKTFSKINGTPQSSDWTPMKKAEESIYPDVFEINEYGCSASHEYWEGSGNNLYGIPGNQTRNRPSVLWKRIIEMPHDMHDYFITSSDLIAILNGSANVNVETPNDTLTGINPSRAENDHTKFYVQLTNLEDKIRYETASYEPIYLGNGSLHADLSYGSIDNLTDTIMNPAPEQVLNYYLNRIFEYDYQNFTVILGIDIDCEDNYGQSDRDTYYSLLIKTCNLTFDYEKKINQLSSVSWNQICKKISDISNYTVIVTDAKLNFKYKVNQTWLSSSPNSEIQMLINNNKHPETINLSTATTSFQEAKVGGFDLTNLITDDVNLTLQVLIGDNFALNNSIKISIDDVSLRLSYIIIEPDEPVKRGDEWIWLIYILTAAIIGLVSVFSLYQTHFKYPPLVRKIRKLRKKVNKAKTTKPILVKNRDNLIKDNFHNNLKNLNLQILQQEKINKIEKI